MITRILVVLDTFDDISVESKVLEGTDSTLTSIDATAVDDVIERAADADALLVQGIELDRTVIEALSHLEAIGVYGTGADSVDIEAATEHGIRVLNVPAYGADEVSTHALSLMLAGIRKHRIYDEHVRAGGWDWRTGTPLHRSSSLTVGLVAYGHIARALAEKCTPIFEDVVAYDPYVPSEEMAVQSVEFDELLERADVISIHAPLTEETTELFGAEEFRRMKDTAVLVNTSRGGVIDVDALHEALSHGELAFAGLDVLPTEPPADLSLFEVDTVMLTPHIGWYSEEAAAELRRTLATDIRRLVEGQDAVNVINESALAERWTR